MCDTPYYVKKTETGLVLSQYLSICICPRQSLESYCGASVCATNPCVHALPVKALLRYASSGSIMRHVFSSKSNVRLHESSVE